MSGSAEGSHESLGIVAVGVWQCVVPAGQPGRDSEVRGNEVHAALQWIGGDAAALDATGTGDQGLPGDRTPPKQQR